MAHAPVDRSLNVIFFGTEDFSLVALQSLIEAGYSVAAVVTKPDSSRGRGMTTREPAVKTYADQYGLDVYQPRRLADIQEDLAMIPNRIGVLSSFGKIIPASTLGLFERGIINIHPSLLPRYRGPSPIETAIFNGDDQTGVSLMRLAIEMDAGPIYAQKVLNIGSSMTSSDLYTLSAQTGSTMLIDLLPSIVSGDLQPQPQKSDDATYTQLLHKKDGSVNPETTTAAQIERHVRAYEQYPRTRLELFGHDVIVTKAHVSSNDDEGLRIACQNDSWLTIDTLVAPSGKTVSGADFIRGYKN